MSIDRGAMCQDCEGDGIVVTQEGHERRCITCEGTGLVAMPIDREAEARELLLRCRAQFAWYVEQHLAKSPPDNTKAAVNQNFVDEIDAFVAQRDARTTRAEEALRRISTLRPAGDVATATGTRQLVQQMEALALNALAAKKD